MEEGADDVEGFDVFGHLGRIVEVATEGEDCGEQGEAGLVRLGLGELVQGDVGEVLDQFVDQTGAQLLVYLGPRAVSGLYEAAQFE